MTYVIVSSGHLRGLGDAASVFSEQIDVGRAALRELAAKALVLRASTDPAIVNVGDLANRFASDVGPRLLNEAEQTGDAAKVVRVQTATANMIAVVSPEVMPAVVSRFLAFVIRGPGGIVVSADTIDKEREAARQVTQEAIDAAKQGAENAAEGAVKLGQDLAKAGFDQLTKDIAGTIMLVGALGLAAYLFVSTRK
jgi:hypothetical protein